ncbi:hypothetical protein [Microbacterium rhizosphaerae]|uniref:DUF3459 domain-containing protein n=1 Tax=Microbacterium rhizosphaerae TaxID=1678237 RepID=A0ABZ0ST33_9MICO|nr:hypothetical protein [Microbacterium rhizosphaerae]WPR90427.1 hypothetical protein SM116_03820 [Microbacterium rhizosphaerae]
MIWKTAGREWRSGAWSLELRDDELADIAFEDRIALRSVRAVVRDRNWDTARLAIDDIEEGDGELRLRVHTEGLGADLAGTLRVIAADSRLTACLDLVVGESFWTNRTGLVVLHPAGVAGEALRVRHSGGRHEATRFPADISPHQPVVDIAELDWSHAGLDVSVRFAGDVFEMEDQRNWTDASFKTYSRPLDLPFPYELGAGSHVKQWVEVRARHAERLSPASAPRRRAADVVVLEEGGAFPEIVVGASTAPDPAPQPDAVGSAVLVELDLATPNWRAALDRATAGLPLDVRFVLAEDDPAALIAGAQALRGRDVARVTAFTPGGEAPHVSDVAAVASLRTALAEAGVTAAVVGGARSHFTELNRERHRLPDDLDGIVFSVTPLFHTPSTAQLIESLAIQRIVAAQAVDRAGGSPVHIGPVTLRPRFNNVATTPPPMPGHADLREGYGPQLLDADDERQDAEELAAWTIASAAALAVPGVASVAFFEEWGPRGLRRSDGSARPVAAAVTALAALSGTRLLHGASPDGLLWAVGGVAEDGAQTLLVANLDAAPRLVDVRAPGGSASFALPPGGWIRRGRVSAPSAATAPPSAGRR